MPEDSTPYQKRAEQVPLSGPTSQCFCTQCGTVYMTRLVISGLTFRSPGIDKLTVALTICGLMCGNCGDSTYTVL